MYVKVCLLSLAVMAIILIQVVSGTNHLNVHAAPAHVNSPVPIAPGHTVEAYDPEGYTWLELDKNGEPFGLWVWCHDVWSWDLHIYNEGIPTAPWVMPHAGVVTHTGWMKHVVGLMLVGALGALALIIRRQNK